MAYVDQQDQRDCWNRYYHNNKEEFKKRRTERKKFLRQYVIDAKSVPCMDCGIQYPFYIMQFDHVRGEKKFNLGLAAQQGKGLKSIKEEIAKCEVVCANCHAARTYSRVGVSVSSV